MSTANEQNILPEMVMGEFVVVIKTDGTTFVHRLSNRNEVWGEAKKIIGCDWLDHFIIQNVTPNIKIEGLVNDNGYADWNNDPNKVNQIATYIYNGGKSGHYILGDVVVCLCVQGNDGWEFSPMLNTLANRIVYKNDSEVREQAMAAIPRPSVVPSPEVTISSFDTLDDMAKYMHGDKSVKPSSVSVISGEPKNAEDTTHNK